MQRIIKDHELDAFAGISSARCTNEENYVFQKMIRAVVGTNSVDCYARICHHQLHGECNKLLELVQPQTQLKIFIMQIYSW